MKTTPLSLEEIKKIRTPVRNINIEHKEHLTRLELFALWVTKNIGTMGFFFFILAFNVAWILWNVLAPGQFVFDAGWSFLILLFINNILQILFMPLIMVGQNLQGRHSEARAEADYEVNTKAEREIETILAHLENQNDMMLEILEKIEKK
ncbi:MAG: hypothetical protein QG579_26 [Patescibacteria group bacterium]|nr:hypothetical protein [Patescibacteria group bacterium]